MGIKIDQHTLERAEERGMNEEEIKDVIKIQGFSFQQNMVDLQKQKYLALRISDKGFFMSTNVWR